MPPVWLQERLGARLPEPNSWALVAFVDEDYASILKRSSYFLQVSGDGGRDAVLRFHPLNGRPGEDPEAFEALHRSLQQGWQPVGIREGLLIDDIADGRWQVQRLRAIRTAILRKEHLSLERARIVSREDKNKKLNIEVLSVEEHEWYGKILRKLLKSREDYGETTSEIPRDEYSGGEFLADELEDDLCTLAVVYRRSAKDLEMLSRYETGIMRRLRTAEGELERLQTLRKEEAAATAIDITDLNQEEG